MHLTRQSRGMQFRPKVLVVEVAREFRWKGKLLVTGLFDGEHFFILEQTPNGTVLFTQGEIFSGLLDTLDEEIPRRSHQERIHCHE